MIVVNPVQIDYKNLAEVAKQSRGKINRIYLHWTAGTMMMCMTITTSISAQAASCT